MRFVELAGCMCAVYVGRWPGRDDDDDDDDEEEEE